MSALARSSLALGSFWTTDGRIIPIDVFVNLMLGFLFSSLLLEPDGVHYMQCVPWKQLPEDGHPDPVAGQSGTVSIASVIADDVAGQSGTVSIASVDADEVVQPLKRSADVPDIQVENVEKNSRSFNATKENCGSSGACAEGHAPEFRVSRGAVLSEAKKRYRCLLPRPRFVFGDLFAPMNVVTGRNFMRKILANPRLAQAKSDRSGSLQRRLAVARGSIREKERVHLRETQEDECIALLKKNEKEIRILRARAKKECRLVEGEERTARWARFNREKVTLVKKQLRERGTLVERLESERGDLARRQAAERAALGEELDENAVKEPYAVPSFTELVAKDVHLQPQQAPSSSNAGKKGKAGKAKERDKPGVGIMAARRMKARRAVRRKGREMSRVGQDGLVVCWRAPGKSPLAESSVVDCTCDDDMDLEDTLEPSCQSPSTKTLYTDDEDGVVVAPPSLCPAPDLDIVHDDIPCLKKGTKRGRPREAPGLSKEKKKQKQ